MSDPLKGRRNGATSTRSLVLRAALSLLLGVGAAAATWLLVPEPEELTEVRQALALQNVGWIDMAATHEANEAWFRENHESIEARYEDTTLSIEIGDDRQVSLFAILGSGPDPDVVEQAVVEAAQGLVENQSGTPEVRASVRTVLEDSLAELTAEVEEREAEAERLRVERDALVAADAPDAEIGSIDTDIRVLDDERINYSRQVIAVEDDLANLVLDDTWAPSLVKLVATPGVEDAGEADLRLRASVLAFVIVTGLAAGLLFWRRRAPRVIRTADDAAEVAAGLRVVDLVPTSKGEPEWGQLAGLVGRLSARTETGPSAVIVGTNGSRSVAMDVIAAELNRALGSEPSSGRVILEHDADPAELVRAANVVVVGEAGVSKASALRQTIARFSTYDDDAISVAVMSVPPGDGPDA